MTRFMRTIRADSSKRMNQQSKGTYLAVQRALENVWFGVAAPIEEACEYVRREYDEDVYEDRVRETVGEYINLLIRVLVFDPPLEKAKQIIGMRHQMIIDTITQGLAELEPLRKKQEELNALLSPLKSEVWNSDRQIKVFRQRQAEHRGKQERYRQRMAELQNAEVALQRKLQEIAHLSPVEIDTCFIQAQSMAKSLKEEEGLI